MTPQTTTTTTTTHQTPTTTSPQILTTPPSPSASKTQDSSNTNRPNPSMVMLLRSWLVLMGMLVYLNAPYLQTLVELSWEHLREAWWFRSVYFETVWATVSYAFLIPLYPFLLHHLPFMDRYKVDSSVTYVHQTVAGILVDAVVYMAPLAALDTVMVKRYSGADPHQWRLQQQQWIQTTRALPPHPPSLFQLFYQVIGGVVIYDALFFLLHLALHKQRSLYRWLHACHHQHGPLHAHITNQLSVGERILLILAANQALKFLYSHPLSRAAFVPVFILLLIDNHSGYDLPWGLQHLVPGGGWGGPRLHYAHHALGTRHYQPFLTYLDLALQRWEGRGGRGSGGDGEEEGDSSSSSPHRKMG